MSGKGLGNNKLEAKLQILSRNRLCNIIVTWQIGDSEILRLFLQPSFERGLERFQFRLTHMLTPARTSLIKGNVYGHMVSVVNVTYMLSAYLVAILLHQWNFIIRNNSNSSIMSYFKNSNNCISRSKTQCSNTNRRRYRNNKTLYSRNNDKCSDGT